MAANAIRWHDGALRALKRQVDPHLIVLSGSRAYGTDHAESDWDYRGIFIEPTDRLLTLEPRRENYDCSDPDVTLFEVEKFCRLAAAANPSVLEQLWAPEDCIIVRSGDARRLWHIRDAFMSQRIFKTFGGYARQQLEKAKRGTGGSRGVKHLKREKFRLHTYRLMQAGIEALRTGVVPVRVDDPELLWSLARRPLETLEEQFVNMDRQLNAALRATNLPPEPDMKVINETLLDIRAHHAQGLHLL